MSPIIRRKWTTGLEVWCPVLPLCFIVCLPVESILTCLPVCSLGQALQLEEEFQCSDRIPSQRARQLVSIWLDFNEIEIKCHITQLVPNWVGVGRRKHLHHPCKLSKGDREKTRKWGKKQVQSSWHNFSKLSSKKILNVWKNYTMSKFSVAGLMGMKTRWIMQALPGVHPTSKSSLSAVSEKLSTHLWGPLVQRALLDHLGQGGLVHPWGLSGLAAHLFQGVLGAQVCLERTWCVLEASGPGGRQVWLWNGKNREVPEEWREDNGHTGSSLQAKSNWGWRQRTGPAHTFLTAWMSIAAVEIINSSINSAGTAVLVFVMAAAVIAVGKLLVGETEAWAV